MITPSSCGHRGTSRASIVGISRCHRLCDICVRPWQRDRVTGTLNRAQSEGTLPRKVWYWTEKLRTRVRFTNHEAGPAQGQPLKAGAGGTKARRPTRSRSNGATTGHLQSAPRSFVVTRKSHQTVGRKYPRGGPCVPVCDKTRRMTAWSFRWNALSAKIHTA